MISIPTYAGGEQRILLHNVDWETYERLRDNPADRHVHMTYDEGTLELMSPSRRHETVAEVLALFVALWSSFHRIPRKSGGSTTYKRKAKAKGLEPDKCWYFGENAAAVRARDDADLDIEPPPDLAIEVEVTSPLLPKLPVYAAMGIPEIWWWKDEKLQVLRLVEDEYVQHEESVSLERFPLAQTIELLQKRDVLDEVDMDEHFRRLFES